MVAHFPGFVFYYERLSAVLVRLHLMTSAFVVFVNEMNSYVNVIQTEAGTAYPFGSHELTPV